MVFPRGKHDDQVDSTSQALDNINRWTSSYGLHEFYREEMEQREAEKNEVWVLRAPAGMSMVTDREGGWHRPSSDGLFRLKRDDALPHVNAVGWELISREPGE